LEVARTEDRHALGIQAIDEREPTVEGIDRVFDRLRLTGNRSLPPAATASAGAPVRARRGAGGLLA
jgi:hypothetical protein